LVEKQQLRLCMSCRSVNEVLLLPYSFPVVENHRKTEGRGKPNQRNPISRPIPS
jgi:hypothetical protein